MNKDSVSAVVPAAGIGSRMGSSIPKQYLPVGHQSILAHTLDALLTHPAIGQVVVALHPDDDRFARLSQATHNRVITVTGGAERADSVLTGLRETSGAWVLVHDAARPCVTHSDIDALLALRETQCGGILATPVRDTMKRADQYGRVTHTVDRQYLWHALTPQLFLRDALIDALGQGHGHITDEASAMEQAGHSVQLVTGSASNIKVTRHDDLALAEFYLRQQQRIS